MEGIRIIGPPNMMRHKANEPAVGVCTQPHIETRASQPAGCHFCSSGLYDVPAEGCPACGSTAQAPGNGYPVLDQRSATPTGTARCGLCGRPWSQCIHGWQAQDK
jgi:hypothetical protein